MIEFEKVLPVFCYNSEKLVDTDNCPATAEYDRSTQQIMLWKKEHSSRLFCDSLTKDNLEQKSNLDVHEIARANSVDHDQIDDDKGGHH